MRALPLALGVLSLLVAAVLFTFAESAGALYSGLLFVVTAVVMLVNARHDEHGTAPDFRGVE